MSGSDVIQSPLRGDWLVLNPPGHAPFAFDLVGVDPWSGSVTNAGMWSFVAGRVRASDLPGWRRPVHAPAEGEIAAAHDGEPDRERLVPLRDLPEGFIVQPLLLRKRRELMAGNHVIVACDLGYILLAHLRRGSVRVGRGEAVSPGDQLGEIGNSGNTVAPHLHLHVQDGVSAVGAEVRPFRLARFQEWDGSTWIERRDAALPSRRRRVRFASTS